MGMTVTALVILSIADVIPVEINTAFCLRFILSDTCLVVQADPKQKSTSNYTTLSNNTTLVEDCRYYQVYQTTYNYCHLVLSHISLT